MCVVGGVGIGGGEGVGPFFGFDAIFVLSSPPETARGGGGVCVL